ncbi:MAG: preprotein translocase subunit SecG [Clostridia bacterium]|nr:preprotein translocase subunit SecG [Clostridia bacterium]
MVVFQIALIVLGVFLILAVLMQHGKSHGLSGTIAGGAETFFGKENGSKIDRILARATTVISIAFVVLALVVFLVQPK